MPVARRWLTPLGGVDIDVEACAALVDSGHATADDEPHAPEHSLEVQLPFLQRVLGPEVAVLPVLVGRTQPESVAAVLTALLAVDGALAVVSTDLSHYLDERSAHERDRRTADAVLAREHAALRRAGHDLTDADVTACLRVLNRLLDNLDDVDVNCGTARSLGMRAVHFVDNEQAIAEVEAALEG